LAERLVRASATLRTEMAKQEALIHVGLYVEGAPPGKCQPVEVIPRGGSVYLVMYSPGLVEGIAAGDVIRVTDQELGLFDVLERGGNIAVKWERRLPLAMSYSAPMHYSLRSGHDGTGRSRRRQSGPFP